MPDSDGDLTKMYADLESASKDIRSAKDVLVISHIDADGITSGAIADITLDRLGIPHTIRFEKKITDEIIDDVNGSDHELVWICDLGSGYLSQFNREGLVITDHHVKDPRKMSMDCKTGAQSSLDQFFQTADVHHLNPHEYGMDGSYEVCGAGMTYMLSRTIDANNTDLAYLAIVGAVGDFQDSNECKLVGLNRTIMNDAIANGDLEIEMDLRLFGRNTRPLVQFLQYCNDPEIEGVSDNPRGCLDMLDSCKVPTKTNGEWRKWNDLNGNEKNRVRNELFKRVKEEDMKHLYGEMYRLPRFDGKSGLNDAKEFATVLNSCGRYDDAETGLRICKGDMSALEIADQNRTDHRRHISSALNYVKDNRLVRRRRFIQWFDAGSEIKETVVGIVAGMILSSGDSASQNMPIIAFVDAEDGIKVSARANRNLVDHGLDLSAVMRTAAEIVGGLGGGHTVAAGATIPPDQKDRFLDIVEDLVSAQII